MMHAGGEGRGQTHTPVARNSPSVSAAATPGRSRTRWSTPGPMPSSDRARTSIRGVELRRGAPMRTRPAISPLPAFPTAGALALSAVAEVRIDPGTAAGGRWCRSASSLPGAPSRTARPHSTLLAAHLSQADFATPGAGARRPLRPRVRSLTGDAPVFRRRT